MNPIIYKIFILFLPKLFIITLLILILYSLLAPKERKRNLYAYKVTNFTLNKALIILYVSFFFFLMFLLRVYRSSLAIDLKLLKPFFIQGKNLFIISPINFILIGLICFLICFIILLILIKIHKFFIKELVKYNLYFKEKNKDYMQFCHRFRNRYSFQEFLDKIYYVFASKIRKFFIGNYRANEIIRLDKILRWLALQMQKAVKILPFWFIPILIIYDCIYNDWVLKKVLIYLIFYFIYNIWYRYSNFLYNTAMPYDEMLFNIYYNTDKVVYVNLPDEDEEKIYNHVANGLYHDFDAAIIKAQNDPDFEETDAFYMRIMTKYKYTSTDGGKSFTNAEGYAFTNEIIDEKLSE
jgi:hypothetical protein